MARRYYSSTAARTTLASGVDDTTTTFNVVAVSGWPASYPYTLVIDQDTVNEELVEVSARSGTTLTVTRGVDGTSAVAHDAGAAVNHGVSARDFDEPNDFINGTGVVTETMLASDSVTSAKIVDGTIVNADVNASAAIAQSKIADLTSDLASKVDYALPTNAQTGTAYTFVAADAEKLTTASNGSAVTLTIPPASSVAWPDNTVLRVVNYGAGAVTIDGGSGVTVTNTATTVAQYGAAVAIRTGSDAWTVVPFGGGDVPAATVSSPSATGQYTDSGTTYDYYTFTASGSLTVDTAGLADILLVGGGAAGGGGNGSDSCGAGGGAGGFLYLTDAYLEAGSLTVTVGAGGAVVASSTGRTGGVSRLGQYYVPGGGGGGAFSRGIDGNGSGGGGGRAQTGGTGTSGLGNNGGNGFGAGFPNSAGGGGGAGGAGATPTATTSGGAGGAATTNSITGSSISFCGGGGGTGTSTGASGGTNAGDGSPTTPTAGTANRGGGGGGTMSNSSTAGSGGSGVVIVRVKV